MDIRLDFGIFETIFKFVWPVIATWWWLPVPFILWPFAKRAYRWSIQEKWEGRQKYLLLEIISPKASERPIASMEHVLNNLWSIYGSIEGMKNFRKKWVEGNRLYHLCFEIVARGSDQRFYLRVNKNHADSIRAAFYAQFPGIEFRDAEERYTHTVSALAPNDRWDLYGFDVFPVKSDAYPIKTYTQFFEQRTETDEEKRIDPMNTLLEGLNQLKPEEQIWLQFRLTPVSNKDTDFSKRGKATINKLTHRQDKVKEGFMPPEMKLTQREREIVKAMEDKNGKYAFLTNIRCLYIAPREIYQSGRRALAEQYFSSFSAPDLNILKKWGVTKTKIRHFFITRREYLRKRAILRRYLMRETPIYPRRGGTFHLSTEEVATMMHIPFQLTSIGTHLPHIESRRGTAPANIPI